MSEIVALANNMVKTMYEMSAVCKRDNKIKKLLKHVNRTLKMFMRQLKMINTVGEKSNLLTMITHMKGIREKLKRKRRNTDNSHNNITKESNRIYWEDVDSTFNKRMRTGCITNLSHTDPISFLDDVRSMFARRIKRSLAQHRFFKVWTTFCGEFIKVNASENTIKDFKYINTKVEVITLDSDINDWYNHFVKDTILTQLEEFQVRQINDKLFGII